MSCAIQLWMNKNQLNKNRQSQNRQSAKTYTINIHYRIHTNKIFNRTTVFIVVARQRYPDGNNYQWYTGVILSDITNKIRHSIESQLYHVRNKQKDNIIMIENTKSLYVMRMFT